MPAGPIVRIETPKSQGVEPIGEFPTPAAQGAIAESDAGRHDPIGPTGLREPVETCHGSTRMDGRKPTNMTVIIIIMYVPMATWVLI